MMTAAAFAAVAALLIALVCLAALVEVVNTLEHVQQTTGISEEIVENQALSDLLRGKDPAAFGFPSLHSVGGATFYLFVSPKCLNCATILERLGGQFPSHLSLIVTNFEEESVDGWLLGANVPKSSRVLDHSRRIANQIGLNQTPTIVSCFNEKIVFAASVPSHRALMKVVKDGYIPSSVFEEVPTHQE